MSWEGALLVFVSFIVFAELHSMRSIIKNLHDEVESLNETVRRKMIERINEELQKGERRT